MSEYKLSKRLTDAIEAYEAHAAKDKGREDTVRARNVELARELEAAEAELQTAMDATIEEPTQPNERKETEARRKVAELKLQVSGGEDRAARAYQLERAERERLSREARQVGKEEAEAFFYEGWERHLQAIADAKYAYLDSLRAIHHFRKQANEIYYAPRRASGNTSDRPSFYQIDPDFYAQYRIYTVSDYEANDAYDRGVIRKHSVQPGRQYDAE